MSYCFRPSPWIKPLSGELIPLKTKWAFSLSLPPQQYHFSYPALCLIQQTWGLIQWKWCTGPDVSGLWPSLSEEIIIWVRPYIPKRYKIMGQVGMEGKTLPQPLPWKWRWVTVKERHTCRILNLCLAKGSNCCTPVCGITLKAGCCESLEVLACLMQLYNLSSINSMSTVSEYIFWKNE